MKPQDILFFITIVGLVLFLRKKPQVFIALGLVCLALSIPLFYKWIFFTAQRLVYYGAGLLTLGIVLKLFQRPQK